jgi:hypothetical protein
MSLEALIQAHTEALLANTEAVKLLTLSLAGRTPTASKQPSEKETVAALSVKDKKTEPKKEEPKQEVVIHQDENGVEVIEDGQAQQPLAYETVRALVLKLAPTQRDAIKALNAKHGIANLKVLLDKEDDFSTVNDQVKLEAVYADLQALEG